MSAGRETTQILDLQCCRVRRIPQRSAADVKITYTKTRNVERAHRVRRWERHRNLLFKGVTRWYFCLMAWCIIWQIVPIVQRRATFCTASGFYQFRKQKRVFANCFLICVIGNLPVPCPFHFHLWKLNRVEERSWDLEESTLCSTNSKRNRYIANSCPNILSLRSRW